MEANFQEILDSLIEKPPRSRLERYRDLIEELLERGRTYREIRNILAEKCNVRVSLSTLHRFAVPHLPLRDGARQSLPSLGTNGTKIRAPGKKQSSVGNQQHLDQVRQRIAALKTRNFTQTKPEGFSYDPDQPLRLLPRKENGGSDK
jgi:hypothetical protein